MWRASETYKIKNTILSWSNDSLCEIDYIERVKFCNYINCKIPHNLPKLQQALIWDPAKYLEGQRLNTFKDITPIWRKKPTKTLEREEQLMEGKKTKFKSHSLFNHM